MATDFGPLYAAAGQQYDVDPGLLQAVAQVESSENPQAISPAGAAGIMQLMPATAQSLGVDPMKPGDAISGAAKHISGLLDQYGNVADALKAYNAGPDPSHWSNPETTAYPEKVLAAYTALAGKNTAPTVNGGDIDSALGVGSSTPAAPISPTPAPATNPVSGSDIDSLLGTSPAPSPTAAAPAAADAPLINAPILHQIGSGGAAALEGIVNSGERLANYVDQRVPALASLDAAASSIPGTGNLFRPAAAAAQLGGEIAAQDQAGAGSVPYIAGKLATGVAATMPVMGGVSGLLSAGADSLGIPSAATVLANAPRAVQTAGNALALAAKGAAQGAGVSAMLSGASPTPAGQQIAQGAEFGGMAGPLIPAAIGGIKALGQTALGGAVAPDVAALAQTARDQFGLPLGVGQITSNPFIRAVNQYAGRVPFSGGVAQGNALQDAFNEAAGNTIGLDGAQKITPELFQQAKAAIGQKLDDIGSQTTIPGDQQLLDDLAQIHDEAPQIMSGQEAAPVQRQVDNVINLLAANNGQLPGDVYQNLTKFGTPMAKAIGGSSSNVSNAVSDIKNALSGAMLRSLQTNGQDDLANQLSDARLQYKNLKTLQPLVEKSATGDISAPALQQQVRKSFGGAFIAPGQTQPDLVQLSRIGQAFLKAPPDSGTPSGLAALELMKGLGTVGASAVAGGGLGGALYAAGGAAGTVAAAKAVRAYLGSNALASLAIRNALSAPVGTGLTGAIAANSGALIPAGNALLNSKGSVPNGN